MVLALLTVFFGIVALYAALYFYGKVRSERDWPTVYGRILERGLGRLMSTPSRSYLPHVKYTYSVDGREYTNDQVYLIRGTGGRRGSIMRLVTGLPDPVPVHYNPEDPARSYLIANSMSIVWLLVAFGVVVLPLGLMQVFVELTRGVR